MIFVPATPRSELKRRYEKEVDEAGMKIRVMEQSGIPLKCHLQGSNPFKSEQEALVSFQSLGVRVKADFH